MIGRRDLFGALALGVPLVVADAPKADAPADAPARPDPASPADGPCLFFTPAEMSLVEALIDRLVPSDALGLVRRMQVSRALLIVNSRGPGAQATISMPMGRSAPVHRNRATNSPLRPHSFFVTPCR